MMTREEMQAWFRSFWTDVTGASTRSGHPAPFPVKLAERLIRMFSFAGDTVLDPFLGTGSTVVGAVNSGRNSIGVEIEPRYLDLAKKQIEDATGQRRPCGPREAMLECRT